MFICPYQDHLRMIRAQYRIPIKPDEKRLYLIKDDKIYKSYPMAVGKPTNMIPPRVGCVGFDKIKCPIAIKSLLSGT